MGGCQLMPQGQGQLLEISVYGGGGLGREEGCNIHGLNLLMLRCRTKPAAELGVWGGRAGLGPRHPTAAHGGSMEIPHPHHCGSLLQTVPAACAEQPWWQCQSACPQAVLWWSLYWLWFLLGWRVWMAVFLGDNTCFTQEQNRSSMFFSRFFFPHVKTDLDMLGCGLYFDSLF